MRASLATQRHHHLGISPTKNLHPAHHTFRDGGSDLTLWMMEEEYAMVMAVSSLSPVRIQTCMLQTANQRLNQDAEAIKHLARGPPRARAQKPTQNILNLTNTSHSLPKP